MQDSSCCSSNYTFLFSNIILGPETASPVNTVLEEGEGIDGNKDCSPNSNRVSISFSVVICSEPRNCYVHSFRIKNKNAKGS